MPLLTPSATHARTHAGCRTRNISVIVGWRGVFGDRGWRLQQRAPAQQARSDTEAKQCLPSVDPRALS